MIIDILTIAGTVISFLGLIISGFTLWKTSNVEKAIIKQKIIQGFNDDYWYLKNQLTIYLRQLQLNEINPIGLYEIYNIVAQIKLYSENAHWDKSDVNEIRQCFDFIDTNSKMLKNINMTSQNGQNYIDDLTKKLNKVDVILKKEGLLNGIGSDRILSGTNQKSN